MNDKAIAPADNKQPEKVAVDLAAPIGGEKTVGDLLKIYERSFQMAAPQHLDVKRFMRITLMEISKNPTLLECTAGSLLGAVMISAQLGLEIGSVLGQAYLVPFQNEYVDRSGAKRKRKEAQLIPGYKGLIKLARNSGEIESISANVVYKQDHFKYVDGLEQILEHIPNDEGEEKDADIIAAYAVARFKSGGHQVIVIKRKRLDKIRNMSKAPNSPAYTNHLPEMFKKAAIRRLSKVLPLSPELQIAATLDARSEAGRPQSINLLSDGLCGTPPLAMPEPEPGDGDSKGDTVVLLSESEQGKIKAWIKKFKWITEGASAEEFDSQTRVLRERFKKEIPDLDVSAENFDHVIAAIPAEKFERIIEVLESKVQEKKQPEKKEPKQGAAADDPEREITKDEYDDLLWTAVNDAQCIGPAKDHAKKLGDESLKKLRKKNLAAMYEFIKANREG